MSANSSQTSQTLDVEEIIDAHPVTGLQVRILALCFIIVLIDGFDVAVIGYIAPTLRQDWSLSLVELAPLFAAGLLGLMVGSMVAGPAADLWGRKPLLVASLLWFGLASIACAHAGSLGTLIALRFLTGLGLGGAMPTCITLCAEYAPRGRRMLLVTLSWTGFTLGLALGGAVATPLLHAYGWEAPLWAGGIAPLVLLPFIVLALPESLRFLAQRPEKRQAITRILHHFMHVEAARQVIITTVPAARKLPVSHLFGAGYTLRTLLLWLTFFCSLFTVYLLTSWLPTLLAGAGYAPGALSTVGALFPVGGTIGALVLALLSDRTSVYRVLGWALMATAVCMVLAGQSLAHENAMAAAMFAVGFGIMGVQNGLNLLGATIYPTEARATGVSYGLAAGRVGSIVGSQVGASLFALAGSSEMLFTLLAIPAIVAGMAIFGIAGYERRLAGQALKRKPTPARQAG